MNILVLGASGMAGHVIATYLSEHGHTVDTLAAKHKLNANTRLIDVTDSKQFLDALAKSSYDAVVNCIGVLVKQSEQDKDKAVYLNAYLPRLLEQHYKDTDTKIIHISSDGVFSGKQPEYVEDSPYDGQSIYSRSKALGEINNDKDLSLRTSIIGPELQSGGTSLFNWFYSQNETIKGFTDSRWKGVTTIELAKIIEAALEQDIANIYNLEPKNTLSKFDLLQLFNTVFKAGGLPIEPASGATSNANLRDTRKDFAYQIPNYEVMVRDMSDWIKSHQDLYPHYQK